MSEVERDVERQQTFEEVGSFGAGRKESLDGGSSIDRLPTLNTPTNSTIRILVTTDNHVGYNEQDPVRGDDSWITFHEIMMMAKEHQVDMILQAGDLFHVNKPSRKSLFQVIRSLRIACYGDKPCELELLSQLQPGVDKELNHLNYEDPNINVAIPFFGISGNHDDAAGESLLSPMDVLAETGLINHFGRVPENDNITVSPILLRKGTTKLALYGMANVRDERLFRTFRDGQVKFLRPSTDQEEWFNLFAVHQNHSAHTETSYLPESFIPDFMDLVIWGHEHECLIDPRTNPEQQFSVMQPGSSVATSLIEAEAKPKYVAILSVKGKEFSIEKLPLKTVRPFAIKTVILSSDSKISPGPDSKGPTIRWLMSQVESLIEQCIDEWIQINGEESSTNPLPLPLVRLKVEYSGGYEVENPRRFSNRFVGRVANVNDVIQFFRKKTIGESSSRTKKGSGDLLVESTTLENLKVENLIDEFLKDQQLELLPENGLSEAITQFVDKDNKMAVKKFVDGSLDLQVNSLLELDILDEQAIRNEVSRRCGIASCSFN